MSESDTKRKKTTSATKRVWTPQERVLLTRDYLVGLIIPRLLTPDNVNGIVDLASLYAVCTRMRALVDSHRDFVPVKRWNALNCLSEPANQTKWHENISSMPEHALSVGAVACFRYFLYALYQKTVPKPRDGESREDAWNRQIRHEFETSGTTFISAKRRSEFVVVMWRCAWLAGQSGYMAAIGDIANVGLLAVTEESYAKSRFIFGKSMFSRPLKIAMKGAASRGHTQLCKDIYDTYLRARSDRPELFTADYPFVPSIVPEIGPSRVVIGSPYQLLDTYSFFIRGMRYAAMYGHEETARECMRLAFSSPGNLGVAEKDLLSVACGPLTALFDELDPGMRQISSYWRYMQYAFFHGRLNMMVHLYETIAAASVQHPPNPARIDVVLRCGGYVAGGMKHDHERVPVEEQVERLMRRAECKRVLLQYRETLLAK